MMVQRSRLIGRRIVQFERRPFPNGRGGRAYRPVITLDNGARLAFLTQETDTGEYGTEILYIPGPRRKKGAKHGD